MSLIKKVDVPEYFAARRAMRLNAIGRVIKPPATAAAGVVPVGAKGSAAKFIEDFSLEHSSSSAIVPPSA